MNRSLLSAPRKQSFKANQWLKWIEHQRGITLKREEKIDRWFVDGVSEATREVFEFYGCYWHGCPTCHLPSDVNRVRSLPMAVLHQETEARQAAIEALGYKVVSIWEHDFDQQKEEESDVINFLDELNLPEPLNPRDDFKGGRVEPFKLLHNVEEGEKIHYYDVTSGK